MQTTTMQPNPTQKQLPHGNFTALAEAYSKHRPGYSPEVIQQLCEHLNQPIQRMHCVDVGAGTGIWTRALAECRPLSITAIEPNTAMLNAGKLHPHNGEIAWVQKSAEQTDLDDQSMHLVSMASSFHWTDFTKTTHEFHRILKDKGTLVALWNPRHLENQPLMLKIEQHITQLAPWVRRVSSGKSAFVESLMQRLDSSPLFGNMKYLEGFHTSIRTPAEYLSAWRSVNDLRSQMGELLFESFLQYVSEQVKHMKRIKCTFHTRAWVFEKR